MAAHDNRQILEFTEETLSLAGAELARRFGGTHSIQTKADSSLVTDADLASEKIVIDRIKSYYPDDLIYSEESGKTSTARRPGSHVWIIDPLDGTTNYANAYPFYCVSIGRGVFRADGSIDMQAGGVIDPSRGKTYLASQGGGAYCGTKRLQVAPPRPLGKSFLCTGFYYKKGDALTREMVRFSRLAEICSSIRRDGAAALDLALVAEGIFDGFWEVGLQPWDLAAGILLIAEAGGVVQNYPHENKKIFDVEGEGIVTGSPGIVQDLAALLY